MAWLGLAWLGLAWVWFDRLFGLAWPFLPFFALVYVNWLCSALLCFALLCFDFVFPLIACSLVSGSAATAAAAAAAGVLRAVGVVGAFGSCGGGGGGGGGVGGGGACPVFGTSTRRAPREQ